MLSVIRPIIRKEFIQLFRDKRMIMPLFVAPVIQLILFGFAATVDIKNITLAVVDHDRTAGQPGLTSSPSSGRAISSIKAEPDSSNAVDELARGRQVQAALVIPPRISGGGSRRGRASASR